jgi:glycosyltransferase involved in cell wall biosynthesis
MEAMAMQVPVISTSISGIPELVQHEHTGLLTPPENVEALAQAICRLLVDEKLRRELASAGRRHVELFHNLETNAEWLLQNISRRVSAHDDDEADTIEAAPLAARVSKWTGKIFSGDMQLMFA